MNGRLNKEINYTDKICISRSETNVLKLNIVDQIGLSYLH